MNRVCDSKGRFRSNAEGARKHLRESNNADGIGKFGTKMPIAMAISY